MKTKLEFSTKREVVIKELNELKDAHGAEWLLNQVLYHTMTPQLIDIVNMINGVF
jgi:hypothetical protein